MSKRIFSMVGLLALMVLMTGVLAAAAPLPNTLIELVGPESLQVLNDPQAPTPTLTMSVGETLKVSVEVTSDQQFLFAQALPSFFFPGKGVVAVQGGDHAGGGIFAPLEITFQTKSPTAAIDSNGVPVHMVVGVRYPGGYVVVRDFLFNVIVVE
jgi:hypothetical protein